MFVLIYSTRDKSGQSAVDAFNWLLRQMSRLFPGARLEELRLDRDGAWCSPWMPVGLVNAQLRAFQEGFWELR